MKATLTNLLTGQAVEVHSTTESPDSSYGLPAWVDAEGNSYGQCQFGAPFGFSISDIREEVLYLVKRSEQMVIYYWTGSDWTTDKELAKPFESRAAANEEVASKKIVYLVNVAPLN